MTVCLAARISQKPLGSTSPEFSYVHPGFECEKNDMGVNSEARKAESRGSGSWASAGCPFPTMQLGYILPVVVIRFFSDDTAIDHVLPY